MEHLTEISSMINSIKKTEFRKWTFSVKCETSEGEVLAVTGNCTQLGDWRHDKPFLLKRADENSFIWTGSIDLPLNLEIRYRYFVCNPLTNGVDDNLQQMIPEIIIVRRWETNLNPRIIKRKDVCPEDSVDIFGIIGGDDIENVDNGWLTAETIIQFSFTENSIQFWKKKHQKSDIKLRMVSVDLLASSPVTEFGDSNSANTDSDFDIKNQRPKGWPIIEVATINEEKHKFSIQNQFGELYNNKELIVFQAQVLDINSVAFMIDFYMDTEDLVSPHLGFCHILPTALKNSKGKITIPITSSIGNLPRPIGSITAFDLLKSRDFGHPSNEDIVL